MGCVLLKRNEYFLGKTNVAANLGGLCFIAAQINALPTSQE